MALIAVQTCHIAFPRKRLFIAWAINSQNARLLQNIHVGSSQKVDSVFRTLRFTFIPRYCFKSTQSSKSLRPSFMTSSFHATRRRSELSRTPKSLRSWCGGTDDNTSRVLSTLTSELAWPGGQYKSFNRKGKKELTQNVKRRESTLGVITTRSTCCGEATPKYGLWKPQSSLRWNMFQLFRAGQHFKIIVVFLNLYNIGC